MAKTKGLVPRLARAHGYVDGYMKALLDAGVATQQELSSGGRGASQGRPWTGGQRETWGVRDNCRARRTGRIAAEVWE